MGETHWKQRASKNWGFQGDANTHFCRQFANGSRRNSTIAVLDADNGEIRGQKELSQHVVDFYKQLFRPNEACPNCLGRTNWN